MFRRHATNRVTLRMSARGKGTPTPHADTLDAIEIKWAFLRAAAGLETVAGGSNL
jgi:hypothetical protein